MITEKEIHTLSKKWGIDHVTVIREYIQILFLSYLYSLKRSANIFFKGGTAIRLLHYSFRFSEDLDFTSTLPPDETIMIFDRAISNLNKEIPTIKIEKFKPKKTSLTSRIKYEIPNTGYPLGIHLEISVREKPITKENSQLETLFPISPYPIISHLSADEILSEKIRAILKRAKGRDLFDIWFLLTKEVNLDWAMVEKKMKFYGETITPKQLLAKISTFDEKRLFQDLAKFLPRNQRIVIPKLKENVMKKLEALG